MDAAHLIEPNPLWIAPFVALLLCIALMPFLAPQWWHRRYPWVAVGLGALTVGYYVFGLHHGARMLHSFHEYVSFICLIGSLFVVSGGIHINVRGESTPTVNVLYLLSGALVANILGTTGASMLLIRPFLRTNKYRLTAYHVVFFLFIVSNVGGCLTPLGDPPLFLGYLRGVPFLWVAEHCWPMWAFTVGALLAIFWVIRAKETAREEWRFQGLHNVFFLILILVAVFIRRPPFVREAIMIAAALGSYFTTAKPIHEANDFNFAPLREVAFLFLGIFATMVPALDWLELNSRRLGIETVGQFYWGAGSLSSVLDNAPTYLCFLSAAIGLFTGQNVANVHDLIAADNHYLVAISVASVFFGACTYIGNGPNFMVKSIADHANARTPSFFGYVFRYVLPILLPVYAVVWWIWFRG
jgi:Na+/H+ antiporter NhaD/arsenite permease-like protein